MSSLGVNIVLQTKVLLFSQSAGSGMAWIVSSLPQAMSLINAAIPESGAEQTLVMKDKYQAYGVIYANALGCNITDVS
jgi:para-nitrobenzyl esterase